MYKKTPELQDGGLKLYDSAHVRNLTWFTFRPMGGQMRQKFKQIQTHSDIWLAVRIETRSRQLIRQPSFNYVTSPSRFYRSWFLTKWTDSLTWETIWILSQKFFYWFYRCFRQNARILTPSLVAKMRQVTQNATSQSPADVERDKYPPARPDRQTDRQTSPNYTFRSLNTKVLTDIIAIYLSLLFLLGKYFSIKLTIIILRSRLSITSLSSLDLGFFIYCLKT